AGEGVGGQLDEEALGGSPELADGVDGGHDVDVAVLEPVEDGGDGRVGFTDGVGGVGAGRGDAEHLVAQNHLLIVGGELHEGQSRGGAFGVGGDAVAVSAAHRLGFEGEVFHVGYGVLPGVGGEVAGVGQAGDGYHFEVGLGLFLGPAVVDH